MLERAEAFKARTRICSRNVNDELLKFKNLLKNRELR
jgi:hypothetical protein